jgi:hypothetical protein
LRASGIPGSTHYVSRHRGHSAAHRENFSFPAKLFVIQPLVNPPETLILHLGFYKSRVSLPHLLGFRPDIPGQNLQKSRRRMQTPYDLLRRDSEGNFAWLEAASDLAAARVRLQELASRVPGKYVLFDQQTQQILEEISSQAVSRSH